MRIAAGDIGASRAHSPIWDTKSAAAPSPRSWEERNGASATAGTGYILEGVSRTALNLIAAADFFTIEAWTRRGLQRFMVLFFIELSTRKVEIAGITSVANGLWMDQIGRNLTDAADGLLISKRYLVHDRDLLFTSEFLKMVGASGVVSVKLPARSPNLNAYAERFVRTIKESCLERLILFGEDSVRRAASEFTAHYHRERNHQGLDNKLICPDPTLLDGAGQVQRRERLGGLLNYYYRAAA